MNEQHLREQLQRLATELQTLPLDADKRDSITALIADIEAQLDAGVTDESLVEQVETAISSFEAEHPRLAAILNSIATALSNIGI